MLLQILLTILVFGVLYKVVLSHGCGLACQRRSAGPFGQRGVRAECTCACATCPCSPLDGILQPFNINPDVLQTCKNKVLEWISPVYGSSTGQQHTQITDSCVFPTPIVIEEARKSLGRKRRSSESFYGPPASFRPSETNFTASEPNFRTEAGNRSDDTSSSSKPSLKRNKMDIKMSDSCNKCKQKGLTCMGSCPKAKPSRSVANNTDI